MAKKPTKVSRKGRLAKKPLAKKRLASRARVARAPVRKPINSRSGKRTSWLDEKHEMPIIDKYAQQLESFLETMADGRVDSTEIDAQEKRLVKLMKKVEPKLDDEQHALVTELLCELTAYDLMQMLHEVHQAKPATTFRG